MYIARCRPTSWIDILGEEYRLQTAILPIPAGVVMGNLAQGALVVGQQVRRHTRVCARACAHSGCRRAGRRAGWPVYDEWMGGGGWDGVLGRMANFVGQTANAVDM